MLELIGCKSVFTDILLACAKTLTKSYMQFIFVYFMFNCNSLKLDKELLKQRC